MVGVTLMGCSPKVVAPAEVQYRDRVEYRDRYVRDTIYESLTEHIYHKNDTIFQEVVKYKYKEFLKYDTVYITRTDSIHVTDIIVREKELNGFQRSMIMTGIMAIIVLAVGVFLFIKNKIKL